MKYMSYCLTLSALLSFSLAAMELSPEDLRKKYGAKSVPGHGPVLYSPEEAECTLDWAYRQRRAFVYKNYLVLLPHVLHKEIISYIKKNHADFLARYENPNSHVHLIRSIGTEEGLLWELQKEGFLRPATVVRREGALKRLTNKLLRRS